MQIPIKYQSKNHNTSLEKETTKKAMYPIVYLKTNKLLLIFRNINHNYNRNIIQG